jgi:hypoxanthine-DNA glycosylase
MVLNLKEESNRKLVSALEMRMKESFPPIADENAQVLILGTMPGDESLRRQEYYTHPRNRFWKLIAATFNETLPSSYEDRKTLLHKHHLALWDVAETAEREGGLDSKIVNERPHDLDGFLDDHKKIELVCFNGQKTSVLFDKYFIRRKTIRYMTLPSTSPANAAIGWTALLVLWSSIKL